MRMPSLSKVSLARKCQLLFGAAVLSIIAASLFIPGMRIHDLTKDRYLRIAKESATIALVTIDLQNQPWNLAQDELERAWPRLLKLGEDEFSSEPPRLITVAEAQARIAAGYRGFITETVKQLQDDREALYKFKFHSDRDDRKEYRLAMAVRATEGEADPGSLKGVIEVRVPIQPETSVANIGVLTAAACCGAMLAILVFYLVTQKLLLSPVRKLRRVAEQVTSGDMAIRSTIATGDEYEDLGNAFNDMLGHLQASQEELRKINVSLDTRLGELAETNVALFESNRLKGEFIANVSHELRTPLVSIIGFAELLADFGDKPPTDNSRLLRYAGNILTSGRMLLDIINDLLDLAKIEAGKLELHIVEFNPQTLCTALIDFVTPLADKKDLRLSLNLRDKLPEMSSDAGRLKQILYNLLSNAIKFTPQEGSISLSVDALDGDMVSFTVADSGPGISPEEQEIIFDKFRQIDSSVTRQYSGTGLGLAITRELAAMLGGSISMESEMGKGSTFSVRLPTKAPADAKIPLINLT